MRTHNAAFTPIDTLIALLIKFLAIALAVPMLANRDQRGADAADADRLRGIVRSHLLWAQNNRGRFPLPSDIDTENLTVAARGRAKDTTAHVHSLLLFNGFVTPEFLVSEAERGNVEVDDDYTLFDPTQAVDPRRALWDPAFRADFTAGEPGNISFAHPVPTAADWRLDNSPFAVASNRGPRILGVEYAGAAVAEISFDRQSITLGPGGPWEGYVGYTDNHVALMTALAPEGVAYEAGGGKRADVLFYDEPDAQGRNTFLSLFIKAGDQRSDFESIWD